MTTWTTITNAQTDQDSPITQTLVQALRDNVNAAAEGATGAPANIAGWHPYDMVDNDDGADGKAYDYSVDGATNGLEITLTAGFEYRFVFNGVSHGAGVSRNFLVDVYRTGTASYSALFTSANTGSSGQSAKGQFDLYCPGLAVTAYAVMDGIIEYNGDNAGMKYLAISASEYISKVRFRFSNDDAWDGGTVYVYRRQFLT